MKNDIVVPNFNAVDLSDIKMPIITIFNNKTIEYTGYYVARIYDSEKPTNVVVLHSKLEELRKLIPVDRIVVPRSPTDYKHIIESYI